MNKHVPAAEIAALLVDLESALMGAGIALDDETAPKQRRHVAPVSKRNAGRVRRAERRAVRAMKRDWIDG